MFDEAEILCLGLGARLCTAAELVNLEGSGTGCGHDNRRVWSSSTSEESTGITCGDTERIAVKGRFDGDMQSIECVDTQTTRYVHNLDAFSAATTMHACLTEGTISSAFSSSTVCW